MASHWQNPPRGDNSGDHGAVPTRGAWTEPAPALNLGFVQNSQRQGPYVNPYMDDDFHVSLPRPTDTFLDLLSESGTYTDGGLTINSRRGLVVQADAGVTSLSDLEPLRELGRGSSALVTLVQHKLTNRKFALKEMQMSVEEPVRSSIRRELAINQTRRDHVVDCYQTFYHDGRISIVLEYMDGGSLADVLRTHGSLSEPYLAQVARQALLGLLSLHRDHIIHRDIKPSNMLLNCKGEVKITDFGVSTLLTSTLDVGQTFVGTYTYMSPERISGDDYRYNSDTWSLGLSILECAIGHFPYQAPRGIGWSNFYELLNTVVQKPAPEAPRDRFSSEFCDFIACCLLKDPVERPSVAQVLEHEFIKKYDGQAINIGDLL